MSYPRPNPIGTKTLHAWCLADEILLPYLARWAIVERIPANTGINSHPTEILLIEKEVLVWAEY